MVQHTGGKTKERFDFSKKSLKTAINHLIESFCFSIENVTMKESVGINLAPFWQILFLYSYEEE